MQNHITQEQLEQTIFRLSHDLEEARRQQEILQRRHEKFTVIADSTPMAMMMHQDDRWLYINHAAELISGFTLEELYDMHFQDMVHPDFRGLIPEKHPQDRQTSSHLEFKIRTKDGADKWVNGVEILTTIGDRPAWVISLVDITDRKKAEEALRASEEKYRLLAETATDVIFTMDEKLRFTYISPSVTRMRGYTVEEAMAQTPCEALTPASYNVAVKVFTDEMGMELNTGKDKNRIRVLELEEICKDGSTKWTESIFNAIRDDEGKFIGMLGITRDITDRKRAEEERERLITEKRKALSEVKILSGMLPICSACKKIRDDQGYWNQIETYIKTHSEANFTHGLCPECAKAYYPASHPQDA